MEGAGLGAGVPEAHSSVWGAMGGQSSGLGFKKGCLEDFPIVCPNSQLHQ